MAARSSIVSGASAVSISSWTYRYVRHQSGRNVRRDPPSATKVSAGAAQLLALDVVAVTLELAARPKHRLGVAQRDGGPGSAAHRQLGVGGGQMALVEEDGAHACVRPR